MFGTVLRVISGVCALIILLLTLSSLLNVSATFVRLRLLRTFEEELRRKGYKDFASKVTAPFFSAVLGALLGSLVPFYFTNGSPPIWVRVAIFIVVGAIFYLPFRQWRGKKQFISDKWFELSDEENNVKHWADFLRSIRAETATMASNTRLARRADLCLAIASLAFVLLWLLERNDPSIRPQLHLGGLLIPCITTVVNIALSAWLRTATLRAELRRLATYESMIEQEISTRRNRLRRNKRPMVKRPYAKVGRRNQSHASD